MPISLNINIDKVDKKRFFEGKKGRYLDLVLFETPDSEYGDYMVKQRGEKGERMVILGNAKYFKPKEKKESLEDEARNEQAGGKPAAKDPW